MDDQVTGEKNASSHRRAAVRSILPAQQTLFTYETAWFDHNCWTALQFSILNHFLHLHFLNQTRLTVAPLTKTIRGIR